MADLHVSAVTCEAGVLSRLVQQRWQCLVDDLKLRAVKEALRHIVFERGLATAEQEVHTVTATEPPRGPESAFCAWFLHRHLAPRVLALNAE
jgi:hypothetical protein